MTDQIYQTTVPEMTPELKQSWRNLLNIFHNETDQPFGDLLTDTQLTVIDIIAKRRYPRTQLVLPTQYGKSKSVAQGLLLRVTTFKEKWAIVAPSEEKGRIIMDYIIEHIFDDERFIKLLDYDGTKEKLLKERSKTRITFRGKGEVRVYSANASNTQATKKALMGFGAANVILDESALISDDLYATVKRMIGGTKDNFLLEIGNPFTRNHFYRTWTGGRYKKVWIDVEVAIREGRYTREYIKEMEEEAFYDVLYLCLFPDEEEIIENGYRRILSDLVIDDAISVDEPVLNYLKNDQGEIVKNKWGFDVVDDLPMLGIDVAGGGSAFTKYVIRYPRHGFAKVVATSDSDDLDEIADKAEELIRQYNIEDYRCVVDAGGVGHGLAPILKNRGYFIKAVLFGESSPEKAFTNMRAFMYWEARKWLKKEQGLLIKNDGWQELKLICYKQTPSLKMQIEPKEEMIKRKAKTGEKVKSPDTVDAFVLTFVDTTSILDEEDIFID